MILNMPPRRDKVSKASPASVAYLSPRVDSSTEMKSPVESLGSISIVMPGYSPKFCVHLHRVLAETNKATNQCYLGEVCSFLALCNFEDYASMNCCPYPWSKERNYPA